MEFPVGGSEGAHSHPDHSENLEELYFVISGVARLLLNGESHLLYEGDAALTKPNDIHGAENAGDAPLRVMVIRGHPSKSRPDFKEFETVKGAYTLRSEQSV